MTAISNILYWISTGLLVPVIVLLIFFFLRSLLLICTFFGQYMAERKTAQTLDGIKQLTPEAMGEFIASLPDSSSSPAVKCLKEMLNAQNDSARLDLLVSEYELASDKALSTSKILTKMGPILGLMGTLIPMGPALVGLATGDIASMAYNMQVAFATTVVGLVISAIGFITQQARERWALHNLMLLDFAVESLKSARR